MKSLDISEITLEASRTSMSGVFSYILHSAELSFILKQIYLRDNLCLKVFRFEQVDLADLKWGDNNLRECTIIQNLVARAELAPRVYDIVTVGGKIAQVTDYLEDGGQWVPEKIEPIQAEYGLIIRWDMNHTNWRSGKIVDFQGFRFHDREAYTARLVELAYNNASWGSRSDPYQQIPGLFAEGQRDLKTRIAMLGLDELDFVGKSVLDVGCNLGVFLHHAAQRGATRCLGIDLPHVAEVAFEISNYLGYWNVDFVGMNAATDDVSVGAFDIVYALSVAQHVGLRDWLVNAVGEVMFWEGHVPHHEETWRPALEQHFKQVDFLGTSRDHGPRPVFACWK